MKQSNVYKFPKERSQIYKWANEYFTIYEMFGEDQAVGWAINNIPEQLRYAVAALLKDGDVNV